MQNLSPVNVFSLKLGVVRSSIEFLDDRGDEANCVFCRLYRPTLHLCIQRNLGILTRNYIKPYTRISNSLIWGWDISLGR